jgi:hypothetical protein
MNDKVTKRAKELVEQFTNALKCFEIYKSTPTDQIIRDAQFGFIMSKIAELEFLIKEMKQEES